MCDLVKNKNGSLRFCKVHGRLTETSECELSWMPFWGTLAELQAEVGEDLRQEITETGYTWTTVYERVWHPAMWFPVGTPIMAWTYTDKVIWKKPWS